MDVSDRSQVPAECRDFYTRYHAALSGESRLSGQSRALYARSVRRFLRWLPRAGLDPAAVLTSPAAWQRAAAAFTASAGAPLPYRSHLADAARRTGLAGPRRGGKPLPPAWQWVHDGYAAALSQSGFAPATRAASLRAVDKFLRWLGAAGYRGDLRQNWTTCVAAYLQALVRDGRQRDTILNYQTILLGCGAVLGLPGVLPPRRRHMSKLAPGEAGRR